MGNVNWGLWSGGVPTYGNYGGPGYTGGVIGGTTVTVKPVDEFDAVFQRHDIEYGNKHYGHLLSMRTRADKQMFAEIEALKGTTAWDKLSTLDKAYINAVLPAFTYKIADRKVFNFQQELEKAIMNFAQTPRCFLAGT